MSDISKNLKYFRRKNRLTQEQLAAELHVTRQTVSGWETDKFYPDLDMVLKLSEVFHTDPNSLLYPMGQGRRKNTRGVTPKVVICIIIIFFIGMTWGGGISSFIFQKIVGGGVAETYLYPIYGGIIMLAVLIAVCTCWVVEEIREKE